MRRPEIVPAVLLVVAFVVASMQNPLFLDPAYLLGATSLYAELGLLTLGLSYVILTGNIDLSVASNLALSACVVAKIHASGAPMELAVVAGLVCGCGLGALNGVLVAYGRLPSFLVTLATMAVYRGAAQALMGSASVKLPSGFAGADRVSLAGVPLPLLIVVSCAVATGLIVHRTVLGRRLFAIGTNETASMFSGVPVQRCKVAVFVIAGALAGVGALLMDSRLGVARFDHARGMELDAITAVVLGGVSIFGGRGTVVGTMLALLLVAVVRTALGLANVSAESQLTLIGVLLIGTVGIGAAIERLGRQRRNAKVQHG